MQQDQMESIAPIALLAMREAGADGFTLHRRRPDSGSFVRLYAYGAGRALSGEGSRTETFPLRVNQQETGRLVYIFHSGEAAEERREVLELAARTIESIWSLDRAPDALVQLAHSVGRLQTRLADLKIADRARGLVSAPRSNAVAIIANHVDDVIKTHRLAGLLEQMARDLENQVEERKLIARAKALLQSTHGLSEEQAYSQLRASSRKSRRRMAVVARQFVEGAHHARSN